MAIVRFLLAAATATLVIIEPTDVALQRRAISFLENSIRAKRLTPPETLDEAVYSVGGRFKKVKNLDQGKTARVIEASIEKAPFAGQHCAVKVYQRPPVKDNGEKLKMEVAVLRAVHDAASGFPKLFYPDPTLAEPVVGTSQLGKETFDFYAMSLTGPNLLSLLLFHPGEDLVTLEQAVQWMLQAIKALQVLHGKGYAHNDAGTPNIVVALNGKYDTATLIDFADATKFDPAAAMAKLSDTAYGPYGDYHHLIGNFAWVFGHNFANEKVLKDRFKAPSKPKPDYMIYAIEDELKAKIAVAPEKKYKNLAEFQADVGTRLVKALVGSDPQGKQTGLFSPEWNALFPEAGPVSSKKPGRITSWQLPEDNGKRAT